MISLGTPSSAAGQNIRYPSAAESREGDEGRAGRRWLVGPGPACRSSTSRRIRRSETADLSCLELLASQQRTRPESICAADPALGNLRSAAVVADSLHRSARAGNGASRTSAAPCPLASWANQRCTE